MSARIGITSPWWFTDRLFRKYLKRCVPYLTGRLLDAGCGAQPYRNMFRCEEYVGMEMSERFKPDILGDVRHMDAIGSESFDSVLSNQVLEPVDDVEAAVAEMHRVLKPGGCLCVSVPFIGRLHGMPHDYWRFSISGVRHLLEKHGFEVAFIEPMGGFLTTMCYLWNFHLYERTRKCAVARCLCRALMTALNPLSLLLHRLDRDETTPFNYVAVARKREKTDPVSSAVGSAPDG